MLLLNVHASSGGGAGRTTGQDISDAMKILTRNGGRADAPSTATRNSSLRNGGRRRPTRNNGSEQMRLF